MRYTVAYGEGITQLEMRVKDLLDANWIPQGGVTEGYKGFVQAMVKDGEEAETEFEFEYGFETPHKSFVRCCPYCGRSDSISVWLDKNTLDFKCSHCSGEWMAVRE